MKGKFSYAKTPFPTLITETCPQGKELYQSEGREVRPNIKAAIPRPLRAMQSKDRCRKGFLFI